MCGYVFSGFRDGLFRLSFRGLEINRLLWRVLEVINKLELLNTVNISRGSTTYSQSAAYVFPTAYIFPILKINALIKMDLHFFNLYCSIYFNVSLKSLFNS